jgi:hypothetical protein
MGKIDNCQLAASEQAKLGMGWMQFNSQTKPKFQQQTTLCRIALIGN